MSSIDLLSCFFQLVNDLKSARIVKLGEDKNLYSVMMIFDLDGDDDE